jgi:hypothetical protein
MQNTIVELAQKFVCACILLGFIAEVPRYHQTIAVA